MKSLSSGAIFRYTRVTRTFMDPCGPRHVYALYGHFSLIIPYLFFPYFFTKDFIIPYIIDNRMRDFPHHHSIIYYFTPLYILLFSQHSLVVYKDNFPLFYMYKSSRYYFVFDIDLGPMFPQSIIF